MRLVNKSFQSFVRKFWALRFPYEVIMSNRSRVLLSVCVLSSALFVTAQDVTLESDTISGLPIRAIGPAAMGGRIADIAAVREGGRLTIYVGSASGGVWKSVDAGTTFKPVFDKQPSLSIGSIAIDPQNSKTVWVGTGEAWVRNSVSVGDGIYKTTDGGENWQRMGLQDTERIARIIVDPKNSDVVYVAATGHLWNANEERGLFKTADGGKTWKKVLFVNADTGCANIAMDPQDSNIIYAAMWQFRRRPYDFNSGGPGSGLFRSNDGGATWKKLTKDLPGGDLGRIGVAVARSRPNRVYAVPLGRYGRDVDRDELGREYCVAPLLLR
jgi:hypothetical protein